MKYHNPNKALLTESLSTYQEKIDSGFFKKYLSGNIILDIGYKGDKENADTILPGAIGIDKDFPGYDGIRLPYSGQAVDSVYSSHCLEHISDYSGAILEWFRVLKIGGYLITVVPSMFLYEGKRFPPSKWNMDHKRFYSPSRLLREFEETLPPACYRVRSLTENFNPNAKYCFGSHEHSQTPYEIELVIQKIEENIGEN